MIKPVLQNDAFLKDVRNAEPGKLHLWWLGQRGFRVESLTSPSGATHIYTRAGGADYHCILLISSDPIRA